MSNRALLPQWLQTSVTESGMTFAPDWLKAAQAKAAEDFMTLGLPTRKSERWKYADLTILSKREYVLATRTDKGGLQDKLNHHRLRHGDSLLMPFVNGYFMSGFSDRNKIPTGVIACGIEEALEKYPDLVQEIWQTADAGKDYPFAILNEAASQDGMFLYIPDHCELAMPVHLLSIVNDPNLFIANPRHIIKLGKYSKLTLIEDYYGQPDQSYFMNVVNTIIADEGAILKHYKLQHEGRQATHLSHSFVYQKKDSQVNYLTISTGALFAKDETRVMLNESGTDYTASGFYSLKDKQFVDHHLDVNHYAPASRSEMFYKGIMDDQSRAVFNGRLHVAQDAQKITAYQANHNLLLSSQAEVNTKPELEIYADDVKCKHGASTGQLDKDALFYLCSRGIPQPEAQAILIEGFADEVIKRIDQAELQSRIMEMLS